MSKLQKFLFVLLALCALMDINTAESQAVSTLNFRLKAHMVEAIATNGQIAHDVNISSFNSGAENPPFLVVNFIIKY